MISPVLFMCLTNTVDISSSSNMNNTTSPSNSNNNNNNDQKKDNTDDILDVIFDYNGNGDDELTLRSAFDRRNKLKNNFFFFEGVAVNWKSYRKMNRYQVLEDGGQGD